MSKIINFFPFLILLLTTVHSLPISSSHRLLIQSQYTDDHYLVECKQIEHTDDDYLCVEKEYQWVLEYVDAQYEEDLGRVVIQFDGNDQDKEKLKAAKGNLTFMQAHVEHENVKIEYIIVQEDAVGNIIFKTVPIPDHIKPYESQLPKIIHNQIDRQFADKRSNLFTQAVILVIVLVVFIGIAYYWRKSTLSSKIDHEPADLKEEMMARVQIQQEQNRKPSAGIVRASEPPPKMKKQGTGV